MACPKTNPNYPNTATSIDVPMNVVVRKLDPDFDKENRLDRAYEFGRHVFKEDSLAHGAYVELTLGAEQGFSFTTEGGQSFAPENTPNALYAFLTYGSQDGIGPLGRLLSEANFVVQTEDGRQVVLDTAAGLTIQNPIGPFLQAIDARFKADNGFCDPVDDGTVFTGTGAGGANPGAVPSILVIKTEGGTLFRTEDGKTFLAPDVVPAVDADPVYAIGAVFKGA